MLWFCATGFSTGVLLSNSNEFNPCNLYNQSCKFQPRIFVAFFVYKSAYLKNRLKYVEFEKCFGEIVSRIMLNRAHERKVVSLI